MVNARFGDHAVPYGARAVAPGLMVMAIILFMGAVSGAHLNPAVSTGFALMLWELVLITGLVSVILGTASGTQQLGTLAAIGVGGYIALAGLWGAPVSGVDESGAVAGPGLVLGNWAAWWAYLVGPSRARLSPWASPTCCGAPAEAPSERRQPRAPWASAGAPAPRGFPPGSE